jgi:thioredoxin reductase
MLTMNHAYYDVVIIGSGMAGLYAAHQIKRLAPRKTFIILEKNKKHDIGGRAGNESFYGTDVAIGAGVGRKHKDHRLIQLLKRAKVKCSEFEATRNYIVPFPPVDIMKTVKHLRAEYKKRPEAYNALTFKQFFIKVLGEEEYRRFVITSGYTDYETADTYETLYKYGMDDNTSGGWTAISIPWTQLVHSLHDMIGNDHFKFSSEVARITDIATGPYSSPWYPSARFQIETSSGATYYSSKVVVATTISGVKKILRSISASSPHLSVSVYQQIHGQPFLMVYAKFDNASRDIVKQHVQTFTVVNGPLQKMIPMNPDKGVYMIAYTDNAHAHALVLKGRLENTRKNCDLYAKWVENALGIQNGPRLSIMAIKSYYWSEGTHYYAPLSLSLSGFKTRTEFVRAAQHPHPGIAVVGEAVSRNQGWVEGALDSVDAVITKDWLDIS